MTRLYVETNWFMSVATGRTPQANHVASLPHEVEIAIPVVCFMEAHTAFKSMVSTSAAVLQRDVHSYVSDPTDDMILASIIQDAEQAPCSRMAFFSEDEGLRQPSLVAAMEEAGITMLDGIASCLAWCN